MNVFAGSLEIRLLCWAVVLGLVQLVIATTMATRDRGLAWNLSPRDTTAPPVGTLTGRMLRAFHNFRETFVYFAAAILIVTWLGRNGPLSTLGAQLYFWARVVYVPVYASGVPVLRTIVWAVSLVGIVMVLAAAGG